MFVEYDAIRCEERKQVIQPDPEDPKDPDSMDIDTDELLNKLEDELDEGNAKQSPCISQGLNINVPDSTEVKVEQPNKINDAVSDDENVEKTDRMEGNSGQTCKADVEMTQPSPTAEDLSDEDNERVDDVAIPPPEKRPRVDNTNSAAQAGSDGTRVLQDSDMASLTEKMTKIR